MIGALMTTQLCLLATAATAETRRVGDLLVSISPAARGIWDVHPRRHGTWKTWVPPPGPWAYGVTARGQEGIGFRLEDIRLSFVSISADEPDTAIKRDPVCEYRERIGIKDKGVAVSRDFIRHMALPGEVLIGADLRFLGRPVVLYRRDADFLTFKNENLGRVTSLRTALTRDVALRVQWYSADLELDAVATMLPKLERYLLAAISRADGKPFPMAEELDAVCPTVASKPMWRD
jgi:hypothetical protein